MISYFIVLLSLTRSLSVAPRQMNLPIDKTLKIIMSQTENDAVHSLKSKISSS